MFRGSGSWMVTSLIWAESESMWENGELKLVLLGLVLLGLVLLGLVLLGLVDVVSVFLRSNGGFGVAWSGSDGMERVKVCLLVGGLGSVLGETCTPATSGARFNDKFFMLMLRDGVDRLLRCLGE